MTTEITLIKSEITYKEGLKNKTKQAKTMIRERWVDSDRKRIRRTKRNSYCEILKQYKVTCFLKMGLQKILGTDMTKTKITTFQTGQC